MTVPAAVLDHLVMAADTLDQGEAYVQAHLGVYPASGDRHASMGLDHSITIHSASAQHPPGLFARIMTPNGVVVLD